MNLPPFYTSRPCGRPSRLTFVDRVTAHVYTILPPERGFPAHDPRSRVRVYEDGRRVSLPPNVPNDVASAYAYAVERARFRLATGRLLDAIANGDPAENAEAPR